VDSKRRAAAFTLIELLVVISVIAILAALALPAMNGAIQTARKSEVRAMANQIKLAVSTYYAEYGTYPTATNSGPDFLNAMSGATNITAIPNRRGIRFLEVPAKYSNALGVVTPVGFYKEKNDRRVFNIHADTNYDGRLEFNPGPGQTNMPGSVAVWVADPTQTNKTIGTW
jgi:prepilin-type N-terminal cleavage/methylation domain-containing protein